jgi:hypothetical protein
MHSLSVKLECLKGNIEYSVRNKNNKNKKEETRTRATITTTMFYISLHLRLGRGCWYSWYKTTLPNLVGFLWQVVYICSHVNTYVVVIGQFFPQFRQLGDDLIRKYTRTK